MADLAEQLWEARKQGSVVRPEDVIEPSSTEEAYAIQGQIVRLSGCEIRGIKDRERPRRRRGRQQPEHAHLPDGSETDVPHRFLRRRRALVHSRGHGGW